MLRVRGVLTAIALAGSVGCHSGSSSSISIRPGVATIHVGRKANNPDCKSASVDVCPSFEMVTVSDVDGEGSRLAVLRLSGLGSAYIDVSEDLGKTWRELTIPKDLNYDLGWDGGAIGVHLEGGNIYLVMSKTRTGAGGLDYAQWYAYLVDPMTGQVSGPGAANPPVGFLPYKLEDGSLRYMASDYNFETEATWPNVYNYDPGKDTFSGVTHIRCTDTCRADTFWSENTGTFDAFENAGTKFCRFTWSILSSDPLSSQESCVGREAWPAPDQSMRAPVMYQVATPYCVWSRDGQAYASTITKTSPATVPPSIGLGPGQVNGLDFGSFNRPRFGNLQLLKEVKPPSNRLPQGRLVRLGASGPEEVSVPGTPCTNDDSCGYTGGEAYGYREVQWIMAWDTYALVFYTVQSQAEDNQQTLYVSRENLTVKPITATPPPDMGGLPAYPGSQPMTTLEKACAVYAGCYGTPPYNQDLLGLCFAHFYQDSTTIPGMAAARDRFIAASTSCDALKQAYPEGFPYNTSSCTSSCFEYGGTCSPPSADGGWSTDQLCSLTVSQPDMSRCNTCDSNGNFLKCDSTTGNAMWAVPCSSNGLGCKNSVGCVSNMPCGTSPTCDGTTYEACDSTSGLVDSYECGLEGAQCSLVPPHLCTTPDAGMAKCDDMGYWTHCEGSYLLRCAASTIHYVDCTQLGFSGCMNNPAFGGECQP